MVKQCLQTRGTIISESELNIRRIGDPAVFWSSFAGVGFIPVAPGTWGTVAAVFVWWFGLSHLAVPFIVIFLLAYLGLSVWAADVVQRRYGVKDAGLVVSDEAAGMWIALIGVPKIWWMVLIAFAAFRLLDIWKPGPIGYFDRELDGGFGVMADDVLAGVIVALGAIVIQITLS